MEYSEFTERFKPSAQKIIKTFLFVFALASILSCKEKESISHKEGELTIYADPSNENLLEALTDIYKVKYPKVNFKFIYQPENKILQNLLDTVANAAFINKPLTEQQTRYLFQQTEIRPISSLLAYDAVVFVVSKDSPYDSISIAEIKNGILNQKNKFIFDNGNSGNFNTIKEMLKLEIPNDYKIDAMNNAQGVFEFIQKSPNSIGVVGLNEISEKYNPKVKEIMKNIKILPVIDSANLAQAPTVQNILGFKYPFFKGVYFISREAGFGIGSGFARFAGSEQGQLIVKREGLQPNYIYTRNVQINLKPIE